MDYDGVKPARSIIIFMKLFGLWDFNGQRFNIFYKFYAFLIHGVFTFLTLFGMIIHVFLTNNIDELVEVLYIALPELIVFVKVVNIFILKQRIVDFMKVIEQDTESQPRNEAELKMLHGRQDSFVKSRNAYTFIVVMCLVDTFINSLEGSESILPFPCWIPFDYNSPEKFLYVYSYLTISVNVSALAYLTVDVFQAYILFNLASYYKLIALRLESYALPDNVEELTKIIRLHQFSKRMLKKCQDIISIPMFVQIVLSASIICFTIYQFQKISVQPRTEFALLGIVMALQIYLPCYYGNEVTLSAAELVNAVYNSNWVDMPPQIKKLIFVYMEFLKMPIHLRAGGFFNIGLDIFTKTMNNAYSLYALLLNVQT